MQNLGLRKAVRSCRVGRASHWDNSFSQEAVAPGTKRASPGHILSGSGTGDCPLKTGHGLIVLWLLRAFIFTARNAFWLLSLSLPLWNRFAAGVSLYLPACLPVSFSPSLPLTYLPSPSCSPLPLLPFPSTPSLSCFIVTLQWIEPCQHLVAMDCALKPV